MRKIKVKKSNNLKNKRKPYRLVSAISLSITLGVAAIIESFQLPYHIALIQCKKSGVPHSIAELEGEKRNEEIAAYFEQAIMENDNIEDEQKTAIIEGYTTFVIDRYGKYFSEDVIANLYATAYTVEYKDYDYPDLFYLYRKNGGYAGEYYSLIHTVYVTSDSGELASHEEMHATSKGLFWNTGFATVKNLGISGLNEGMTAMLSYGDSYKSMQHYCRKICAIIGYEKMINYYFSADLKGLKNELEQYLSKEEISELLDLIDMQVSIELGNDEVKDTSEYEEKIEYLLEKMKTNARDKEVKISLEQLLNDYNVIGQNPEIYYRK